MNRRLFFKNVLSQSAQAIESVADQPRPSEHRPIPSSATRVVASARSPRQYRPGDLVLVAGARAWLGCDEIGFYAIDATCPHLGCLISQVDEGQFVCAAHGSCFGLDGVRQSGPAKVNLRYLLVDLDDQGQLIIRRDQTAHPADRLVA